MQVINDLIIKFENYLFRKLHWLFDYLVIGNCGRSGARVSFGPTERAPKMKFLLLYRGIRERNPDLCMFITRTIFIWHLKMEELCLKISM